MDPSRQSSVHPPQVVPSHPRLFCAELRPVEELIPSGDRVKIPDLCVLLLTLSARPPLLLWLLAGCCAWEAVCLMGNRENQLEFLVS